MLFLLVSVIVVVISLENVIYLLLFIYYVYKTSRQTRDVTMM